MVNNKRLFFLIFYDMANCHSFNFCFVKTWHVATGPYFNISKHGTIPLLRFLLFYGLAQCQGFTYQYVRLWQIATAYFSFQQRLDVPTGFTFCFFVLWTYLHDLLSLLFKIWQVAGLRKLLLAEVLIKTISQINISFQPIAYLFLLN